MPPLKPERVVQLALDLNVLWSDQRAKDLGLRGTAASMLVDAVWDGTCPAGPVQLITSVPVIEAWADVLRRHFGYGADAVREKAEVLTEYARQGPVAAGPRLVVGAGHVPFGTEHEVAEALRTHASAEERGQAVRRADGGPERPASRACGRSGHPGHLRNGPVSPR